MAEKEHRSECAVDHCPVCGVENREGYNDLVFTDDSVLVRMRCPACGTEFTEEYVYNATYHYTY